jgi:hypothetical protein
LQIDLPIIFCITSSGDAIDNPVETARQLCQRFGFSHVAGKRLDASGFQFAFRHWVSSQPENFVAEPDEFRAERHTDVTAADN